MSSQTLIELRKSFDDGVIALTLVWNELLISGLHSFGSIIAILKFFFLESAKVNARPIIPPPITMTSNSFNYPSPAIVISLTKVEPTFRLLLLSKSLPIEITFFNISFRFPAIVIPETGY